MTQIRIKRVYEPASPDDGYRVLVDKLWPRGMSKDALHYDLWPKGITPADDLRRWFHAAPEERWEEFRQRYTAQLKASAEAHRFVRMLTGADIVTLLFASKNAAENHALVLQEFLQHEMNGVTAG